MAPLRRIALAVAACGLVLTAGCGEYIYGDQTAGLSISNSANTSYEITILVDGEKKSKIVVDGGEEIQKNRYFNTVGEHNVTVTTGESSDTMKIFVRKEDGEIVGTNVNVVISEEGRLSVNRGGQE